MCLSCCVRDQPAAGKLVTCAVTKFATLYVYLHCSILCLLPCRPQQGACPHPACHIYPSQPDAMPYSLTPFDMSFGTSASCLQGYQLDVRVHTLLVITIFSTFIVIVGEMCRPNNFLLAAARPMLIIMQGIWFIQVAHILFRGGHAVVCSKRLG